MLNATNEEMAALHGLTRALAANAVQGVSVGFVRELDIVGIGYRADVKGKIVTFTLGYSCLLYTSRAAGSMSGRRTSRAYWAASESTF